MSWIAIILNSLKLLNWFVGELERRRLITEVEARVLQANLQRSEQELAVAKAARDRVAAEHNADPSIVRQTDKFERKD